MSININSEAWCRKAYLNYHCYGNSMNISADEMGEITKHWESKLTSWQATVSNDENHYEFDDSDYSSYKENGKKAAQDQTDYSGNDAGNIVNGSLSSAGAAAGATAGVIGAVKSGQNIASGLKAVSTFGKAAKGAKDGVATGAKSSAGKACAYIAAGLAIATATMYHVMKPNKTEKKACDELQNVMANNQTALTETQADMANMANEIIDLSDQANEANEDANEEVEEQKTEFDMYRESYEALKAKAESGEPLTEEEKALYQELIQYMTESGELITETQENATDVVGELYEDMGTYQEGYDYAAETMGEVEGTTDFAEGFDSATRTMCYVEGTSQALNAVSGAVAGAQLMGMGFWNWALGIASIAAGVTSGIASAEQFKMAGEVGTEIDMRKDTQTFNTETMDVYNEEIDTYDGFMQGVEDLEIEIPDDLEVPEDTALPVTTDDGLPAGTPDPIKPDVPGKKKEDEPEK